MAKYTQEIVGFDNNGIGFCTSGNWKRENMHLQFGITGKKINVGDEIEIVVKAQIYELEHTASDVFTPKPVTDIWIIVNEKDGQLNNRLSSVIFNDINKFKDVFEALKSARPDHPITIRARVTTAFPTPNDSSLFYTTEFYAFDPTKPSLYIDYKKVKAINSDNKKFKKIIIEGHEYDFARANLPADEQTELQVLIDGYDWTHLSATGKALAANSLTWDQISGEPAIHAGVTITGITHPAIDADGTLVATISFSRLLSDGTTDLATKQVNIAFVLIKAAPLAVWYGDQNGNVYKNGVKTYLSTGSHQIKYIVSKGEDVWYSVNSSGLGKVYKNGVEIYDGQTISTIAIDKDENVYYGGKDKNVYKNGTSIFTCSDWVQSIVIDKDGNWYAADQGRKLYKNGTEITSPSGTRIEKISVYKDGSILMGDYDGWLFENQTQLSKLSNQIFAVLYDKNKNKFAIANDSTLYKNQTSLYSGVYTFGDVSIDSTNGDVYYTSTDKKIYKNGVALYTSEGSFPVVSVSTEWGSRTGNWD